MKKPIFLCLLLIMAALLLCGCFREHVAPDSIPSYTELATEPDTAHMEPETTLPETDLTLSEPASQETDLTMVVNGMVLDVTWEDNETTTELITYVQSRTITVNTTIYGGFEQVGSLPQSFSKNDIHMTTEPGDIVLYSGNQLVVFFGSNTWSYTRLGHINLSVEKLAELLDGKSATIEFKYE